MPTVEKGGSAGAVDGPAELTHFERGRIMKWAKFQSAKSTVLTEPTPPVLMMEGQMFDNGFVDISAPNQANNDATIFQPHYDGADFVWLWRSGVRIGAIGYARLGHPGLAGGSPICCAGVLGRDEIFFHSGHYHPKEVNAKHYMYDLIEQSCITLLDGARDRKVKELCNLTLRFYVPGTTDRTYTTTFKAIINESLAGSTIDSAPEVGRGSSPMTIGSSTAFSPTPVDRRPSSVEDNAPLPPFVYPPARWQPDSSTSRCTKCDRAFTMFRRKHHCRNCGFIFCDACSSHKKDIRHRVARPGASSPETGEVRVCDDCVHLL